jgi:lactoylglutathione lyase
MRVRGLHHAAVYVADLQRSIAFYGEVFGLQVLERLAWGDEDLAFLGVGSARLELIESAAERSTGIVDHVAFEVVDLDALVHTLRERGVTLIDAQPLLVPQLNARILFCTGPDGERIELFQYQPT